MKKEFTVNVGDIIFYMLYTMIIVLSIGALIYAFVNAYTMLNIGYTYYSCITVIREICPDTGELNMSLIRNTYRIRN